MTGDTSRPARAPALAVGIAAGLVVSVIATVYPTRDADVFWHLKAGELIVANRSTLPVDPFSFSFGGAPWRYKDVCAEVIFYLGYAALGTPWLAVLKMLALAGLGAAIHGFALPRRRSVTAMLLATAVLPVAILIPERPNLFSLVAFAAAVTLLERVRRGAGVDDPRTMVRLLAPVVLLDWAWTALHRFALFGHVLAFALAGYLAVLLVVPPHPLLGPRPGRRFVAATFLAALAGLGLGFVNPEGAAVFTSSRTMAGHPELRALIVDWQRLPMGVEIRAFPLGTCLVLLALVAMAVRTTRAVVRHEAEAPFVLPHWALLAAAMAAAYDSVRAVPYLVVLATLLGSRALAEALASGVERRLGAAGTPRLVAATGLALVLGHAYLHKDEPFTTASDPLSYPIGALDFARAHGLAGRVANSYDFGGYVIARAWPDVRVLVDNRNETVYPAEFLVRALDAESHGATFRAMRAEDHATWALAVNQPDKRTFPFLAGDPAWALVFWSDSAALYVLRAAHAELVPLAFRHVGQSMSLVGDVAAAVAESHGDPDRLGEIRAELLRMLEASPASFRAGVALALFYQVLGPHYAEQRDHVFDHLRAVHGVEATRAAIAQVLAAP